VSVVRYTNEELEMRRRAQAVLDDATAGDWHRKRAMGDLKRTERAARARAAQREAQDAKPATAPPRIKSTWESDRDFTERQRAEEFLAAIGGTPATKSEAPAQTDAPAASVVPLAAPPQAEKFCENCRVPFDVCHCDKPKPTRDELAAVAAKDAAENAESCDDLTPCPLCLIPRGRCHHSGRRNPAADISFLQAQMIGRS
jgi:hypothetical protein